MKKPQPLCVFIGLEDSTGHVIDDHLCEPFLTQRGWRLETRPWSVPWDWKQADLLVLRSCYDYWLRADEFEEFLAAREREGSALVNPISLVRWNRSKRYLMELAALGVAMVPSLVLEKDADPAVLSSFLEQNSQFCEFVAKPLVGSGGFEMQRLSLEDLSTAQFGRDVMIQPFRPQISRGEWSAIYFNGQPSHPVIKTAREGEYRVQDSHGGTTRSLRWEEKPSLLEHANTVAAAIARLELPQPCYARYDFIDGEAEGELLLMEVELIEPTLFFTHDPDAAERFVDALLSFPSGPAETS